MVIWNTFRQEQRCLGKNIHWNENVFELNSKSTSDAAEELSRALFLAIKYVDKGNLFEKFGVKVLSKASTDRQRRKGGAI